MTPEEIRRTRAYIRREQELLEELDNLYSVLANYRAPKNGASLSDTETIRFHIQMLNGEPFTLNTLVEEFTTLCLHHAPPKPIISAALSRMAREGELKIVEQGMGRRATVYQEVPRDSNDEETPSE